MCVNRAVSAFQDGVCFCSKSRLNYIFAFCDEQLQQISERNRTEQRSTAQHRTDKVDWIRFNEINKDNLDSSIYLLYQLMSVGQVSQDHIFDFSWDCDDDSFNSWQRWLLKVLRITKSNILQNVTTLFSSGYQSSSLNPLGNCLKSFGKSEGKSPSASVAASDSISGSHPGFSFNFQIRFICWFDLYNWALLITL